MPKPDYEQPDREYQRAALIDAIARTTHYAHAVTVGDARPFSELPPTRQAYLRKLGEVIVGMADTDALEDCQSLMAVEAARTVEGILRDVQEEWEDHSQAAFLHDRFDQVEARLRVQLSNGFAGGMGPVLARLGVKAVR
jgi:hypothetical protein